MSEQFVDTDDPFSSFIDLEPDVQAGVVCSLFNDCTNKSGLFWGMARLLSPNDRRELVRTLSTARVDANGQSVNHVVLSLGDRRSMLWLRRYAESRAMPSELAAIFGVSQQRASQVLGARGGGNTDEALIRAFNAASQDELNSGWRNQGDIERLELHRKNRLAATQLIPRMMVSQVSKTGRWRVYGHPFEVRQRDGAYFIVVPSLFGDDESQPKNTGEDALNDAVNIIREEAQINMSPLEWKVAYKEDFYGERWLKTSFERATCDGSCV